MPRRCEFPEPWLSLVHRVGSLKALAEKLGSSTRLIQYWAKGERRPSAVSRVALRDVFRRHGLKCPEFKK